jgi:cell division protein FtsB
MGNLSKWIWRGVTVVIFIYTAVLIVRNLITVVKVHHRIARLEEQRDHFRERIAEDSTMLSRLKYDEYLEQYAREKYHMQRPNEYIYIVED